MTEQRTAIFGVLGKVHISDAAEEEDLKAKEDVKVLHLCAVCVHVSKLYCVHTCTLCTCMLMYST